MKLTNYLAMLLLMTIISGCSTYTIIGRDSKGRVECVHTRGKQDTTIDGVLSVDTKGKAIGEGLISLQGVKNVTE